MFRTVARFIAATAIAAGIGAAALAGTAQAAPAAAPIRATAQAAPAAQAAQAAPAATEHHGPTFTPCAVEDDSACYWDATTRGNGEGQSFYAGPAPKGWKIITPQLALTLATWGDATDRATRNWAICLEHVGNTTTIACPDGHREFS